MFTPLLLALRSLPHEGENYGVKILETQGATIFFPHPLTPSSPTRGEGGGFIFIEVLKSCTSRS
jgi:hypothetical protein